MKTRSEMKLEKIKLMKDQQQQEIFHATVNKSFLVYRQRTENREKQMWNNFQNYNMWYEQKANLDLVWTYAFKKLPAHDFALFKRANY